MARPGVEYDDIARVARQLVSRGESPSVQKIRDILGTGSNTTIGAHLKTWRAGFAAAKSPALPESVPEDLMNPLDDFWSLAVAKAETNYQIYKDELEAKVATAESAQQAAMARLAEKTREVETLKKSLSDSKNKLLETEQHWHTLQGKHTVATNELTHTHAELERIHTLLQEQNQASETERNQLTQSHEEALQYERDRSTTSENRLLQEIDQLRQTIKTLETDQSNQQKEFQDHKDQSQQHELTLRQELSELNSKNQHIESGHQKNQQDIEEKKYQLTAVQGQLSKSLDTVEALRQALEQSKEKELRLIENISQQKETITQLQSSK